MIMVVLAPPKTLTPNSKPPDLIVEKSAMLDFR